MTQDHSGSRHPVAPGTPPDTDQRCTAIEEFAEALSRVREQAGNPSFRVMSGRSGCISHTTLHEASRGNRFPTWETTAEYLKACGADPEELRDRWERTDRVVNPHPEHESSHGQEASETADAVAGRQHSAGSSQTPVSDDSAHGEAHDPPSGGASGTDHPKRPWWHPSHGRLASFAVLATAVAVAVGLGIWRLVDRSAPPPPAAASTMTAMAPYAMPHPAGRKCPMHPTNPPWKPPANYGDDAKWVGDVTMKDCSHVTAGETFHKVWKLRNVGSVPWKDRTFQRLEPHTDDNCETVDRIRVPDTPPGESVKIEVDATAPEQTGQCIVHWVFKDAQDRVAFPGGRPMYFQIFVDAPS